MPPVLHLKPEEIDSPEKRANYTVTLVGCGGKAVFYALVFAEAGFKVNCCDEDQSVIKKLAKGNVKLGNPQAESTFKSLIRKEQVKVTSDLKAAATTSDVTIITVGAKIDENKSSDSSEIEATCRTVGSALQKGNLVVYAGIAGFSCVETVVKETLENTSGLKAGEDFGVAYNPIVYSFQNPLKQIGEEELTVAADDKSSLNAVALIYQTIAKKGVKKIGNVKTAELAMLFAAVKTDVNEALVNEMAIFCEEAGIDFAEIIKLLENSLCDTAVVPTISEENNRDKAYLLLENVENFDAKLRLSRLARQINEDMVRYAANLTQEALRDSGKTFRRAKVALLGAAEPGTAGAAFVDLLKAKGAKVSRYDPDGSAGTQQEAESLLKKTLNETVEGTDCVVILSGKEQLKRLNLKKLRALMKSPAALVDLVGAVDPENAEGFSYRGLGRGKWKK